MVRFLGVKHMARFLGHKRIVRPRWWLVQWFMVRPRWWRVTWFTWFTKFMEVIATLQGQKIKMHPLTVASSSS